MNHLKYYLTPLLFGFSIMSTNLNAEVMSPYSPAFILKPEQVESNSSIGSNWTNSQYTSQAGNGSAKISTVGGSETISVGLPDDFEIGAGISYWDSVSKSPSNLNVITGWSNPALYANKTWFSNTPTRLKLSLSAMPKTGDSGTRGYPSTYGVGITGIHISQNELVSSLNLSQSIADKNSIYQMPDSTSLTGNLSKEVGFYLINGSIGVARNQSMIYQYGSYLQPSYVYSADIGLSRSFAKNIWGGLNYAVVQNQSTVTYASGQSNAKTLNNSLTASIRILF